MTDEEMAEEYAEGMAMYYESVHGSVPSQFEKYLKKAYLAGLKAGRPVWHDLRKDPTDIPPRKDEIYSIEVLAKGVKGNYGHAVFSYALLEEDGKYNHWCGITPILWTELPKIEEE